MWLVQGDAVPTLTTDSLQSSPNETAAIVLGVEDVATADLKTCGALIPAYFPQSLFSSGPHFGAELRSWVDLRNG